MSYLFEIKSDGRREQSSQREIWCRGFSLIELIIVIALIAIIAMWGLKEYVELREIKRVEHTAKTLVADLEATRAEALAGKYNSVHGIKFFDDSYSQFVGDEYPGTHGVNTTTIDEAVVISTTLGEDESIVFERLDGMIGSTATVTIALIDDMTVYKQIVIKDSGVVQLIE